MRLHPLFEVAVCYAAVGRCRITVVVDCRPGSQPVTAGFFDELVELLKQLAVLSCPTYVAGDFNIRLDRAHDQHAAHLRSVFDAFGLDVSNSGLTHQSGGTLDAVSSLLLTSVWT